VIKRIGSNERRRVNAVIHNISKKIVKRPKRQRERLFSEN
jgi:hypothetical protein